MNRTDLPPLDLSSALTILGDAVTREVVVALDGTGLRPAHGYLVQRLLVGPATATEMAADLGVTQQAVSKALRELSGLGHVEPTSDDRDGRRRPVRLTEQGREAVAAARAARSAIDARIRAALGDERFERLASDLAATIDALGLGEHVTRRTVPPPEGRLD